MDADPQRDWLDEMLAQQPSWDPPAGFATRVAARAARSGPRFAVRRRPAWTTYGRDLVQYLWGFLGMSVGARLEGAAWVVRQYWTVFQR